MRMLDLFCGRWGWSRAFAKRGWECVGVDLTEPPEIPEGCKFFKADVLEMSAFPGSIYFREKYAVRTSWSFDFICASSPCEQFSVHGMKHFHPNPPYPELGIKLFEHTRRICEESGVPYVMENVRAAQQFVGNAVHHCGPFYLWGTGVPPLLNQNIKKNMNQGKTPKKGTSIEVKRKMREGLYFSKSSYGSVERDLETSAWATIPPELANAVADYAKRLCEQFNLTGGTK